MATVRPRNNGGYEYDFVDTTHDRYICDICHLPSRNPCLTECCGHVFCKSCLDSAKKAAAISKACPVCRTKKFVTICNKQADREIKGLHIYCTNKKKGCKWQGELNRIKNHLESSKGCQFEEMKCFNKCGKMIERRYLTSHVETECPRHKVNCRYCHDRGEHQFIEGQHKEECPKLPLPCPNKCKVGSVPREDMEIHRKKCPLEMIQCEYYNVGCKRKLLRKDLEEHKKQKVEEHLMMTTSELTDTKVQLSTVLSNVMVLVNSKLSKRNVAADVWPAHLDTIATMHKLGSSQQVCPVTIKMEGYNDKKVNEIGWYSKAFYTHNKGYKMCLSVDAAVDDDNDNDDDDVDDDNDDDADDDNDDDDDDGNGKGTHLSVYLYLMKGSHDDELTWPLRGKFQITVMNQISDRQHHSVTVTCDDDTTNGGDDRVMEDEISEEWWGSPQFISTEELCDITPTCQYLKDDCLFFQVTKLS